MQRYLRSNQEAYHKIRKSIHVHNPVHQAAKEYDEAWDLVANGFEQLDTRIAYEKDLECVDEF